MLGVHLVQWKPSSAPVASSNARNTPCGSNQASRRRSSISACPQPALLGCQEKARVVHAQQFGIVGRARVGADGDAVGSDGVGHLTQCAAHLHQLAYRGHPLCGGHPPWPQPGCRAPSSGPGRRAFGCAGRAEQCRSDTTFDGPRTRVHDQLPPSPRRRHGRGKVEVPDDFVAVGGQQVSGPVVRQLGAVPARRRERRRRSGWRRPRVRGPGVGHPPRGWSANAVRSLTAQWVQGLAHRVDDVLAVETVVVLDVSRTPRRPGDAGGANGLVADVADRTDQRFILRAQLGAQPADVESTCGLPPKKSYPQTSCSSCAG